MGVSTSVNPGPRNPLLLILVAAGVLVGSRRSAG